MKMKMRFVGLNSKLLREAKKRAIDKVASKGIQIFRQEINKRRLINTRNLIDSVGATKQRSGITFEVNADYAGILNEGVKRHKMRYLINAGPIPIVTRSGRTVFRVATDKNVREKGKWVHPGFKRGKGFFDNSVRKITLTSAVILASEIAKGREA
jgi:hypothetical protein